MSLFREKSKSSATLNETLSKTKDLIVRIQRQLTKDDEHYLDYFWNSRRKEIRTSLPLEIIAFWENEPFNTEMYDITKSKVDLDMLKLEIKKYISSKLSPNGKLYELTAAGQIYLMQKHPKWAIAYDNFYEKKLVGLIALAASIFGIIQFIFWLNGI